MSMAAVMVLTAVLSFTVSSDIWWVCGSAAGMTVLYLGYLRRQTRIESRFAVGASSRMARSRPGVDSTRDREFDVVPRDCAALVRQYSISTTRTRSSNISTGRLRTPLRSAAGSRPVAWRFQSVGCGLITCYRIKGL